MSNKEPRGESLVQPSSQPTIPSPQAITMPSTPSRSFVSRGLGGIWAFVNSRFFLGVIIIGSTSSIIEQQRLEHAADSKPDGSEEMLQANTVASIHISKLLEEMNRSLGVIGSYYLSLGVNQGMIQMNAEGTEDGKEVPAAGMNIIDEMDRSIESNDAPESTEAP